MISLEEIVNPLLKTTKYCHDAKDSDLPEQANCMTAIRDVLKKAFRLDLPHVWVGDLPKALVLKEWQILRVEECREGDLLFTGKHKIQHVAIAAHNHMVFHCCFRKNACLEHFTIFCKERQFPNMQLKKLMMKGDSRKYHLNKCTYLEIT